MSPDLPAPLRAALDRALEGVPRKGLAERANVEVTISYDPASGTTHLNPIYEKDDWSKGYDVVIHDECSADVKDSETIDKILKPRQ